MTRGIKQKLVTIVIASNNLSKIRISAKTHACMHDKNPNFSHLRTIQRGVRRIPENERGQLVTHVQKAGIAASLASLRDDLLLLVGIQSGLGIVASRAQHELLDESVEQILSEKRDRIHEY